MEWISVKDEMPSGEVLAIGYHNEMLIGYLSNASGIICESEWEVLFSVTHWMPLPEPPKQ